MYYFMFVLGFVFLIWYNFHFYHVYNISRKRALWYSLTFLYGMLGANLMGRIYTVICVLRNAGESSRLAIFGAVIFAPLLILFTVSVEKWVRRIIAAKISLQYKCRLTAVYFSCTIHLLYFLLPYLMTLFSLMARMSSSVFRRDREPNL